MIAFGKYGDYEEIAVLVPNGQQLIDDLDCIVKSLTKRSMQNPLYIQLKLDSYLISDRVRSLNFAGNIAGEYDYDAEEDGANIKITFKVNTPNGWPLSFYYLIF